MDFKFAAEPNDSDELKFAKKLIFIISFLCSVCGVGWGALYHYIYGFTLPAMFAYMFPLIVGPTIAIAHKFKKYKILIYVQLICIVWFPTFIQWSIGSVAESAMVVLWGFLAPIGALLLLNRKNAIYCLIHFLIVVIFSVIFEPQLLGYVMVEGESFLALFYVMNVGVPGILIFAACYHFLDDLAKQKKMTEQKSKQILQSINYAKRIQDAIIPDANTIYSEVEGAAMYYRPKDVVSGDFPYYFKKDGYQYFAAIDCTGHGVPGAMMSLIGHLLLNDILHSNELLEPGELLNKLHKSVVQTLKQDAQGVKTSDGMDVALCRISPDRKEILYSGAHRPLYHLKNSELIQYKGCKYPIGGCQYGGKNKFATQTVNVELGDSIYFFSDGYPDQFGGEKNMKFGPKRMRNIIVEKQGEDIKSVISHFKSEFEKWMGEGNQIDDVLLIGVKF